MTSMPWHGSRWPEGVPHEVSGYDKPLSQVLDETAAEYPDQVYTIFQDANRTFSQVKDAADRLANFLTSQGVGKGDRVAIFLPNLPHYPEIFFGVLKTGAVCVTCNPLYTVGELNFQLNDSGAKAVFVMDHPEFYPNASKAMEGTGVETLVYCNIKSYLPGIKGFLGGLLGKIPKASEHDPGHFSYDEVLKQSSPSAPRVELDTSRDLAAILYTGGTTGVPKGAALTHMNLMYDLVATAAWIRLTPPEGGPAQPLQMATHTYLGVLPWYHSFGLTLCMLSAAKMASRLVCIPDPRAGDPPFTDTIAAIPKYKVDMMIAVPTIYSAFINHPLTDNYDLTSLIACGSGAAPLPAEVVKQFEAKTGAVIFEGWGLTETSPVVTTNPTNLDTRKIGSVGPPLPGSEVKIVAIDESTKELALGEDGEIAVHGPQVMAGYWGRPEADAEVFTQIEGKRFFLTGDVGHLDEDGFVVITDRKKDLILVSGFNAYPREIEEVLYTHPKVAQAAVVGIDDSHTGEAVKAFVQLKEGQEASEEEIIEFCREHLAGYKRPKFVEFRAELPTSVVGKVLRRVLRDEERAKEQA
jgi:long-chain acyl-CoA synthetase